MNETDHDRALLGERTSALRDPTCRLDRSIAAPPAYSREEAALVDSFLGGATAASPDDDDDDFLFMFYLHYELFCQLKVGFIATTHLDEWRVSPRAPPASQSRLHRYNPP